MYTKSIRDRSFPYRLTLRSQLFVFWTLLVLMTAIPALRLFGDSWWALVVAALVLFLLSRGTSAGSDRLFVDEHPITPNSHPELYEVVAGLARKARLRVMPSVSILPRAVINAAASGNSQRPRILVTTGLLQNLDRRSVRAVLAHEIAHIAHRDLDNFRFSSLLRSTAVGLSIVGLLLEGWFAGDILWMLFFVALPMLTLWVLLAISRNREYAADLFAAEITADPEALASALYNIEYRQRSFWSSFLGLPAPREESLFRSHPATEERIRRLMKLAPKAQGRGVWV